MEAMGEPPVGTADKTMPVLNGQSILNTAPPTLAVALYASDQTSFEVVAAVTVRQSFKVNAPPVLPGATIVILATRPGEDLRVLAAVTFSAELVPPEGGISGFCGMTLALLHRRKMIQQLLVPHVGPPMGHSDIRIDPHLNTSSNAALGEDHVLAPEAPILASHTVLE